VTEAGRQTALTVCNGVDRTAVDLSSLTGGHADRDDDEPLTRPLYSSNTSAPLAIHLTTPADDHDVAYLLLYEGPSRQRSRRSSHLASSDLIAADYVSSQLSAAWSVAATENWVVRCEATQFHRGCDRPQPPRFR